MVRSLCVILLLCTVTGTADEPVRLSLTGTVPAEATETDREQIDALLALVELDLTQRPQLAVVERQQIDVVLHELALSADLASNEATRLQLGQLVSADLIVTLQLQPAENEEAAARILIRVVESLTGIVRGVSVTSLSNERLDQTATQIAEYVDLITSHPETSPITVAVAPFECVAQFDRLRPLERVVRDMVATGLRQWAERLRKDEDRPADARSFWVVQRSGMAALLEELDLIHSGLVAVDRLPPTLPTRAAAFLVRGTIDEGYEQQDDGNFLTQVSVELIHAASNRVVRELRFEASQDDLAAKLGHQVSLLAGYLSNSDDQVQRTTSPLRRIHETGSLVEAALRDLRRFRRQRPIDFSYRDFVLKGPRSGPPIMATESVLGRAVLHKAIDRLETALFIQPENHHVAYALGYCLAFHIDGIRQPQRADKLLRRVGSAADDTQLRAAALKLLAEISFHHRRGQPDPDMLATAAEQVVFGLIHVPEEHRDGMWARMTELLAQTLPAVTDTKLLEALITFSRKQSDIPDSPHRARFASVAVRTSELLQKLDPASQHGSDMSAEALLQSEDPAMQEMAARKLGAQARRQGEFRKAATIYQQVAAALDATGNKQDRSVADNLKFHAARCLRQAGEFQAARQLLESYQPIYPKSLNAGYRAVELAQCLMHDDENEAALELLCAAVENIWALNNNTPAERLIEELGGAPLRPDREIDVRYVRGPANERVSGRMTSHGSVLLIAGQQIDQQTGLRLYDTKTGSWDFVATPFGAVTEIRYGNERVWASTNHGLWYSDHGLNDWRSITKEQGLPDNHVAAFTIVDRTVYAGIGKRGAGGVVRIDDADQVTVLDGPDAPASVAYSLAADDQRLVAATQPTIHELDLSTGKWTRRNHYMNVVEGSGEIWGSRPGRELFPYGAADEVSEQFRPLWFTGYGHSGYSVSFVIEQNDQLWFGGTPWNDFVSSGFYRFDRRTGDFVMFGPRDGFRSAGSYRTMDGVAVGDSFWLMTSDGLAKVTPRPKDKALMEAATTDR